jgi:hypothetical protein
VGGLNSHCASVVVVVVFGVMARARGARKRNHTKKDGGRREFIITHTHERGNIDDDNQQQKVDYPLGASSTSNCVRSSSVKWAENKKKTSE